MGRSQKRYQNREAPKNEDAKIERYQKKEAKIKEGAGKKIPK